MFLLQVGDSIVHKARETLERAIKMVNDTKKWGARVVYGDTDRLASQNATLFFIHMHTFDTDTSCAAHLTSPNSCHNFVRGTGRWGTSHSLGVFFDGIHTSRWSQREL